MMVLLKGRRQLRRSFIHWILGLIFNHGPGYIFFLDQRWTEWTVYHGSFCSVGLEQIVWRCVVYDHVGVRSASVPPADAAAGGHGSGSGSGSGSRRGREHSGSRERRGHRSCNQWVQTLRVDTGHSTKHFSFLKKFDLQEKCIYWT